MCPGSILPCAQDVNFVVRSLQDIRRLENPSSLRTTFHATMMQSEEAKRRTAQAAKFQSRSNRWSIVRFSTCLPKESETANRTAPAKLGCSLPLLTSSKKPRDWTPPEPHSPSASSIDKKMFRPLLSRQDTLVGDPKRRPRWGVPIKLDIAHVIATDIDVGIMDLLMAKAHYTGGHEDTAIHIPFIELESDQLTRGEQKRLGGIFLGELVWALINILIVKILLTKPTKLMLNSTLAAAFAVRDVAHYTIARTLELAVNVPRSLPDGRSNDTSGSLLHIRLMSGRYLVKHGGKGAISTHCVIQLRSEEHHESNLIAQEKSRISLWSKRPQWNETFLLGPISTLESAQLKVLCVHQERVPGKAGFWNTLTSSAIGELNVPLLALDSTKSPADTSKLLFQRHGKATHTRELVGWFQLGLPTVAANDIFPLDEVMHSGSTRETPGKLTEPRAVLSEFRTAKPQYKRTNILTGQIKLGLRIVSPQSLPDAPSK